jgi:hypothetical protein
MENQPRQLSQSAEIKIVQFILRHYLIII